MKSKGQEINNSNEVSRKEQSEKLRSELNIHLKEVQRITLEIRSLCEGCNEIGDNVCKICPY